MLSYAIKELIIILKSRHYNLITSAEESYNLCCDIGSQNFGSSLLGKLTRQESTQRTHIHVQTPTPKKVHMCNEQFRSF